MSDVRCCCAYREETVERGDDGEQVEGPSFEDLGDEEGGTDDGEDGASEDVIDNSAATDRAIHADRNAAAALTGRAKAPSGVTGARATLSDRRAVAPGDRRPVAAEDPLRVTRLDDARGDLLTTGGRRSQSRGRTTTGDRNDRRSCLSAIGSARRAGRAP
jgi:hypothetical protein